MVEPNGDALPAFPKRPPPPVDAAPPKSPPAGADVVGGFAGVPKAEAVLLSAGFFSAPPKFHVVFPAPDCPNKPPLFSPAPDVLGFCAGLPKRPPDEGVLEPNKPDPEDAAPNPVEVGAALEFEGVPKENFGGSDMLLPQ